MENVHQPVMLAEVLHYLKPTAGKNFIDCTLGGGGHARAILQRTKPDGKLLGIDLDPLAIELTRKATKEFGSRIKLVRDNFKNLKQITNVSSLAKISGLLLDLGLSSNQLQDRARGFSFLSEESLDMRFDSQGQLTAQKILNQYTEQQLIDLFKNFGEEKLARPIAQKIIATRRLSPIINTSELIKIIIAVYKQHYRGKSKINPATKTFQALRIAVNDELENLKAVLPQAVEILSSGGQLVIISYHSLEDKIVKDFFRQESKDCICAPSLPVCQCNHKKSLKIITKKPLEPSPAEVGQNPRSRSAKMRVAEKI